MASASCQGLFVANVCYPLRSNRIGCDGAAIIAQYLGTNPQLVTLNLQANRIQDDGAAAIAEQLMLKNHALQRYVL